MKGTKLPLCRMNNSRDVMHSMMTIASNTLLNTGNLLGEQISGVLITKKKSVTIESIN